MSSPNPRGHRVRTAWLSGLTLAIAGPALLWLAVAPDASIRGRLSVVTGLLALSSLLCAAVLPSRIRALNRAFGIESVMECHRFLGTTAAALTLAHLAAVVVLDPANVALIDLVSAPDRAVAGVLALIALVGLIAGGALRRRLGASYESWRLGHLALAATAVLTALLHVWWLDHIVRLTALTVTLALLVAVVGGVAAHRWVWRARLDPSTRFLVHEVRPESPTVSTLVLAPNGSGTGSTWGFAPGQFAWLRLAPTPLASEHPFTIASSAHDGRTAFTVRHTGDFTRSLGALRPGTPVWVDGPHGGFTPDLGPDDGCPSGLVLIAGGVGITPMMSMLRTAADRGDRRPYRLIVVAGTPADLLFRGELGVLRQVLDLEVTEVLRRPYAGWSGAVGEITVGLLAMVRHPIPDPDWFLCGPPGLVQDVLTALAALEVGPDRIHTELFDLV
jgi:3-phenylpropionate/trans-cinnamate dioxygenase ferredoxin reductase subunit